MFECKSIWKSKHVSWRFVYCSCAASTCSRQPVSLRGCRADGLLHLIEIGRAFFWRNIKISFVSSNCVSCVIYSERCLSCSWMFVLHWEIFVEFQRQKQSRDKVESMRFISERSVVSNSQILPSKMTRFTGSRALSHICPTERSS